MWIPERGVRLCGRCAAGLAGCVGGDYCRLCAVDVGPYLLHDGRCGDCRGRRPALSRLARVGRYEGALRDMILVFKHDRRLAGPLGRLLAEVLERELSPEELDFVVPVPSPGRRRFLRGFHPTGLLAHETSRHVGLRWAAALEMARPMRPQVGLSATERAANVRGAFRPAPGTALVGRRVCVLDDVCTTGATLREAARTLREAGAESVVGVVLARTSDTSAAIAVPETCR